MVERAFAETTLAEVLAEPTRSVPCAVPRRFSLCGYEKRSRLRPAPSPPAGGFALFIFGARNPAWSRAHLLQSRPNPTWLAPCSRRFLALLLPATIAVLRSRFRSGNARTLRRVPVMV